MERNRYQVRVTIPFGLATTMTPRRPMPTSKTASHWNGACRILSLGNLQVWELPHNQNISHSESWLRSWFLPAGGSTSPAWKGCRHISSCAYSAKHPLRMGYGFRVCQTRLSLGADNYCRHRRSMHQPRRSQNSSCSSLNCDVMS